MEEIKTIIFRGFSSTFNAYYNDEFIIERNGHLSYIGTIDGVEYKWSSNSNSYGFQLTFSSLAIELFQSEMKQIIKDENRNGYRIEIITEDEEHFIYTFFGLMEENDQSNIRNVLAEFIPIYEELPLYMESIEDSDEEEEQFLES